jgi:hypothetical protein
MSRPTTISAKASNNQNWTTIRRRSFTPAQLAVLVGPGMGALDRPPSANLDRCWHPTGSDLADMPRSASTWRQGW